MTIQCCCLTSIERQGWLNPPLVGTLIGMTHTPGFEVTIDMVRDLHNYDSARNYCVDSARKADADWLVMFDNDIAPKISPLEMIQKAESDMWVIGQVYGVYQKGSIGLAGDGQRNPRGDFFEMQFLATGCICIKNRVWQRLDGPWFVWQPKQDELLTPQNGEDWYFSDYCRKNDIKLWAHRQAAAHLRSFDLTTLLQACAK